MSQRNIIIAVVVVVVLVAIYLFTSGGEPEVEAPAAEGTTETN
ncbi:MAG: hypothetical protein AAFY56_20360 [Pseudomonadota bacterium]